LGGDQPLVLGFKPGSLVQSGVLSGDPGTQERSRVILPPQQRPDQGGDSGRHDE
jgi:hypothetical protein